MDEIEELDVLIKNVESKSEEERYHKHYKMFEDVKRFIIKRKRVLYGGTALNEMLPSKDKFYSSIQLPDFDAYTPDPKQDAIDLALYLREKGYRYVEVKTSMIHATTFKVFAEFQSVADFTYIRQSFYEFLLKEARLNPIRNQSDPKLILAYPTLLIWSFYRELGRPRGSLNRLIKIIPRFNVFMSHFSNRDRTPVVKFNQKMVISEFEKTYMISIRDYIKTNKIPDIGGFAIGLHLGMNRRKKFECCLIPGLPVFDILTGDMKSLLREFRRILPPFRVKLIQVAHLNEILPKRYSLSCRAPDGSVKTFARIIDGSEGCYSYTSVCGYTVGTIDTILFHLYGNLLSQMFFNNMTNGVPTASFTKTIIQLLENANQKKTLKERFSLRCIGVEKTLEEWRREKWRDRPFHLRFNTLDNKKISE